MRTSEFPIRYSFVFAYYLPLDPSKPCYPCHPAIPAFSLTKDLRLFVVIPYLYPCMYLSPGKARTHYSAFSIRSSVGLLLLLYVSVFLFSPGIVHHTAHDHVEHEEDTCKKDPCHVAIYHHGAEGSCNHKYHFTKDQEICNWCDITLARQLITSDIRFFSAAFSFFSVEKQIILFPALKIPGSHPGRGPPSEFAA